MAYQANVQPALNTVGKINAYLLSYARVFTLKDCLPELPRKIYYDWRKEGLIPQSFGADRNLSTPMPAGNYKKWDRFHLYELMWIRLVYHTREIGVSKEFLKEAAKESFPTIDSRVYAKVQYKFQEQHSPFNKVIQDLGQIIGKRAATHETIKINSAVAEAVASSNFHHKIFNAIVNKQSIEFTLKRKNLLITSNNGLEDTGERQQTFDVSPYVIVPILTLFNDVIINGNLGYLQGLFGLADTALKIITAWKDAALELQALGKLDNISSTDDIPSNQERLTALKSSIVHYYEQLRRETLSDMQLENIELIHKEKAG